MKLSDIEDAFLFVGGASYGEHSAMINKKTGKVYYQSEMGDLDEIPEEIDEPDFWVEVPHKTISGWGENSCSSSWRNVCRRTMSTCR